MKPRTTTLLAALMLFAISCKKESSGIQSSRFAEESLAQADINVSIGSVTIGTQVWMKKDLTVSHYRNGDTIPEVENLNTWAKLTIGAWCWYKNNPVYGKLYNLYAINDPRGLAPEGWHIASDIEWTTLTKFLGGAEIAGGKMKEAGTAHWKAPNTGATNSSGFTALPGGYRGNSGFFDDVRGGGYWWTSYAYGTSSTIYRQLLYNNGSIYSSDYSFEHFGFAVRCVKD